MSFGQIPNPQEWLAIRDVVFDSVGASVDAEALYRSFTHVLHCDRCGRLLVFKGGFVNEPMYYRPEALSS